MASQDNGGSISSQASRMQVEWSDGKTSKTVNAGDKICTIVTLDAPDCSITAPFTPKEISIGRKIPWSESNPPQGNYKQLEFTVAENRTLSFELFFDVYEGEYGNTRKSYTGNVAKDFVAKLEEMTVVPPGTKGKDAHPPRVMVIWRDGLDPFVGVITDLTTKYTMFASSGIPVRATCSLSIKEMPPIQGQGGKSVVRRA